MSPEFNDAAVELMAASKAYRRVALWLAEAKYNFEQAYTEAGKEPANYNAAWKKYIDTTKYAFEEEQGLPHGHEQA